MKLQTLEQIRNEAESISAGAEIKITGYIDTSGRVKDLHLKLLGPEGYRELQKDSLKTLREAELPQLPGLAVDRALVAVRSWEASLEKSLAPQPEGAFRKAGAEYVPIGASSLNELAGSAAVYILRAESLRSEKGEVPDLSTAKDAAVKSEVARALGLPVTRYIHTIKLEPGKFEELEVVVAGT